VLLPIGSHLDTRHGVVVLITAARTGTQKGTFYAGAFTVEQPRPAPAARAARAPGGGVTVLRLIGGSFAGCEADEDTRAVVGRALAVTARRRPRRHHRVVRSLWGSEAGGSWSTVGGSAAATVSGTVWKTEDNCLGTYVLVRRGTVVVHDLVRHRQVTLHSRQSYLALAPDPH
jgi:hypothetical protein